MSGSRTRRAVTPVRRVLDRRLHLVEVVRQVDRFPELRILAIYRRNLDWFRFWLQDIEDPNPAKAEQYERWRKLRELQCANKNSLRDYCNVTSRLEAPR
ncbi:MAG TPA: hypothetical protein VF193_08130 [Steroidobacter sp.]